MNQSEPNVILTAHATKVNRPEPNWTEPQTCLACRNHAFSYLLTYRLCANGVIRQQQQHFHRHYRRVHNDAECDIDARRHTDDAPAVDLFFRIRHKPDRSCVCLGATARMNFHCNITYTARLNAIYYKCHHFCYVFFSKHYSITLT